MALAKAEALFKVFPSKFVHNQKIKLRPNEHHYENEGEEPYIKYSCQLCEQIADSVKTYYDDFEDDEGGKFVKFSFPKGTEQCPCCGVNIDWDYKYSDDEGC